MYYYSYMWSSYITLTRFEHRNDSFRTVERKVPGRTHRYNSENVIYIQILCVKYLQTRYVLSIRGSWTHVSFER